MASTLFGRAQRSAPSFAALERLASSGDIRDRAFAASALSFGQRDPAEVAAVYSRIRAAAKDHHADVRARICARALDAQTLLAHLETQPLDVRDHYVEEILDIAYPSHGAIHHCPSGLAEIVFMLSHADLRPGKTFVDLGAGLGKVVLLVALLTGARAFGVELDPLLVFEARSAARSLDLEHAHFLEGDIRDTPLPAADVYYMYIPLMRSGALVERLPRTKERATLVFSQALDLEHTPWLRASGASSYWLEMYEARPQPRVEREWRSYAGR
jgi:hypothetical protein